MKFTCPHCDQSLETETLYKGSGTVCPSCGGDLTIPESDPPSQPEPEESPEPKEDFRMDFTAAKKVIQENLKNDSLSLHQALTERGIQHEDLDLDKTASGTLASSPNDRYVIGDAITQGGMGAILDAKDVNVRRNIAMKVILRPEQASKEDILRFVREGQVLGQLEHPGIVPLYEVGVDAAGNPFFTMKKVVGLNLGEILRKLSEGHKKTIKDYPLSHLLNIFQRVCDAIAFAHSKRVIHRDLKPENIMIGEYGEVLVIDWGIAKILSRGGKSSATQDLTDTGRSARVKAFIDSVQSDDSGVAINTLDGELMGTPKFMAPEQATGELSKIDDCTDIYALGAILYNILTLHPPITGENLDELLKNVSTGKIKHPSTYNTTKKGRATGKKPQAVVLPHCPGRRIPDALGAVAMKALSLKPKDRYQYVKFLQRDLEAYQTGFATSVEEAGAWKQVKLFVGRNRGVSVSVFVAVVLLIGVMGVYSWVNLKERRRAEQALTDFKTEQNARRKDRKKSAPAMYQTAKVLIEKKDFETAIAALTSAIEYDPDLASPRLVRSMLYARNEDYKEAAADCRAYLKAKPNRKLKAICEIFDRGVEHGKGDVPRSKIGTFLGQIGLPVLAAEFMESTNQKLLLYKKKLGKDWKGTRHKLHLDAEGRIRVAIASDQHISDLSPLRGMDIEVLDLFRCMSVTDLSPLRGMPLTDLSLSQCDNVSDLSPLKGMSLTSLDLQNTRISDLSPLKGMPLTTLNLSATAVSNLSPLKGMPLTSLNLPLCETINDLSPLEDMPLTYLNLHQCKGISDLLPLRGMPLTYLDLYSCGKINDLSPLKGMPLTYLDMLGADVRDLSPLKGMPLTYLNLNNCKRVTDLSPLKGMHLTALYLKQTTVRDLSPLQGMTTLAKCNLSRSIVFDRMNKALLKDGLDVGTKEAKRVIEDWKTVPAFNDYCRDAKTLIDHTIPMLKALKNSPKADISILPEFRGHHYVFWFAHMTWQDAKKFCEQYGGHLVTITSKEEQLWVAESFGAPLFWFWIGGTREHNAEEWQWVTGEKMDYMHDWHTGHPGSGWKFMAIFNKGEWASERATTSFPFIIEWDR